MKTHLRYWLCLIVLLALSVSSAHSADITVDGSTCTLADAITAAINNRDEGGCVGSGTYVYGHNNVVLETDVSLDAALPEITATITIKGNGHTINGNNNPNVGSVLNIISTGDLTLNDTIVTHGYTMLGGGIYNDGSIALTNSMVSDNIATSHGGGIYGYGNITLTNSTISGNIATFSSGGIDSIFGSVTLISSTVSDNTAAEAGGISKQEGSVTLLNSTVSNNTAEAIGGIKNVDGNIILTNSTVSGNTATVHVGGIYNFQSSSDATVTLINSTVTNNTAEQNVGGIYNYDGTVTLTSSLISGNTAGGEVNEVCNENDGTINADSHNVFGHDNETDAEAFYSFTPKDNDINATSDGTNTSLASILDTTLANNGGPTQTHALVAGSPAIDLDPSCNGGLITDDQRGEARPSGAGCDAGSFEFDSTLPDDNNSGFLPAMYLLLL
ncbi:MAG: choice-of-anchor Q domain-containing protein [Candidatus Electrothrix sp. Rat3]|nr:choice-of-anchor Q domain-containing protein [Candidatus Electrothrix rattekaaiensis]